MPKPRTKGVAPGFLLLPAREYEWELQRKIELRLPLKGSISEILNKDRIPSNAIIGGDDEFNIFEDNTVLLWELVRLMFAGTRYPWLEDDECLNVVALEFTETEVVLYGEIIKSLG
jgi:hypothetical protein